MTKSETFTFVPSPQNGDHRLLPMYNEALSGKLTDLNTQLVAQLRELYPELIITTTTSYNVPLLRFASAGHAEASLDVDSDGVVRWRFFQPPRTDDGLPFLFDALNFAKYKYRWANEDFILYAVQGSLQYILKEPLNEETTTSHSALTDELILAAGKWTTAINGIFVFDNYWYKDVGLYKEVQKTSWDNVILRPEIKEELIAVPNNFFDGVSTRGDERYLGTEI